MPIDEAYLGDYCDKCRDPHCKEAHDEESVMWNYLVRATVVPFWAWATADLVTLSLEVDKELQRRAEEADPDGAV